MRVTIIAEAGVNHNGDVGMAIRLVDAAAEAGADYVKFQTFTADRLVTRRAAKADYQLAATGGSESQHEMLRRLELSPEAHQRIIAHCASRGISFLSTGFDAESIDYLVSIGANMLKIPSGELTNLPYLRHIGKLGRPIILSTGMATLAEVGEAIEALELAGMKRSGITVLH
ncbi:MAG: N-acetylneuraminate synthase family protein, partial [Proteobacteria bacterium]|nr:N-acetylneuraminate synthase family protein [Pseudomonadota bacterium]